METLSCLPQITVDSVLRKKLFQGNIFNEPRTEQGYFFCMNRFRYLTLTVHIFSFNVVKKLQ